MQIQQTPTLEMAARFINSTNSFLPEREPAGAFSETVKLYTKHTLSRIHTLNSQRKKVLRATDLLIIDEVSGSCCRSTTGACIFSRHLHSKRRSW